MECEERWEQRECYIPGNVAKNCGECRQNFRGMSLKNPPFLYLVYFTKIYFVLFSACKDSILRFLYYIT